MKHKYLVLDFGNVIVTPTTGDWNITPKFLELVDVDKIGKDKVKEAISHNNHMLAEKLLTLEEELDMFIRFYKGILNEIGITDESIIYDIAYDRTYNNTKYTLCDNVKEELDNLKDKYTLLMLSDNWPCVIPYLKEYDLYDYFEKVYVSSIYGYEKQDKIFFDFLINDYNVKPGEAIFIDDLEKNLDVAKEKGFDVYLMDRLKNNNESKYIVINDLNNI